MTPAGTVKVACPPLPVEVAVDCEAITERIRVLSDLYTSDPVRTFGLEARCAYRVANRTDSAPAPYYRFGLRPPAEPAVFSLYPRFHDWALNEDAITNLASCLVGQSVMVRKAGMRTTLAREGATATFPEPWEIAGWRERLLSAPGLITDPFLLACYVYAELVLSHPLTDGNGRAGRALFQGALVRALRLSAPCLPLGVSSYLNRAEHRLVLIRLGSGGRWEPFIASMKAMVSCALSLSEEDNRAFAGGS
jgi:hypothetical protein